MKLCVHFIGIGGVSLSSLAKYLLHLGFTVRGSDVVKSTYTDQLERLGVKVFFGHDAANVGDAQVVVYSDAIKSDNPELVKAYEDGLFVMTRAQLLKCVAENFKTVVGVGGCHGKTTVTCMLAHIFKAAKRGFALHVGGEDYELSNSAVFGDEILLTEVCEYKKNLLELRCDVAACLSADADHLDCYEGYDELKKTYDEYIKLANKAIINGDDRYLRRYAASSVVRYGEGKDCDYRIEELHSSGGKYSFSVLVRGEKAFSVKLAVYGKHNAYNALAASAIALELGVPPKYVKRGLTEFKGVKRRFEVIGEINGATVVVDYAHHPREISAALATAREAASGDLTVVFQPHTYSRTLFLKDEFVSVLSQVENLALYSTFSAREEYVAGGSAFDLYRDMGEKGAYYDDFDRLIADLKKSLAKGGLLLVLGAGDLEGKFRSYCRTRD